MIHDHFDGSAHCVECDGPCKLTGDSLHLTQVVRAYFEECAITRRKPWPWMAYYLKQTGLDINKHLRRAYQSVPRLEKLP